MVKEYKEIIFIFLLVLIIPLVSAGIFQDIIFTINSSGSSFNGIGNNLQGGFDFNNDGYEDLLVSAGRVDVVYLFYGSPDGFNNMTGAKANITFSGDGGTGFGGDTSIDYKGAGFIQDFNNDTINDILIIAGYADAGGLTDNGQAFVYFGSSGPKTNFTQLDANVTINGTFDVDRLGHGSVTHARGLSGSRDYGDFNGDGISDLILWSSNYTNDTALVGSEAVHIFYGAHGYPHGTNVVEGAISNITIMSYANVSTEGIQTAVFGDINNDSIDDFGMSFATAAGGGAARGEVYIFYGNFSTASHINRTVFDANLTYNGTIDSDNLIVHPYIGDINNDSIDDFILGGAGVDSSGVSASGQLYVFYGAAGLSSVTDNPRVLANFTINGTIASENLGLSTYSIAGGDFNNDLINDLLIGDPAGGPLGNATRIFYGGNGFTSYGISYNATNANVTINNSASYVLFGIGLTLWDMDNDTVNEFVVGDSEFDSGGNNVGQVVIYEVIDTVAPSMILVAPVNNSYLPNTNVSLNITVHDNFGTGSKSGINGCYYSLNGTANVSFTCLANTSFIAGNGLSNLTVFVNDSVGNLNSSHFTIFTVDTVYPRLLINHPTNLSNHSVNTISLNITSVDTNLDSCWVTNVTGQNQSFTCLANTTISGPDGTHNITIFANDSAGNLNMSGIITFTLDTVAPSMILVAPVNNSYLPNTNVSLNITVHDNFGTGSKSGINGCYYSLNGTANVSFTCLANTSFIAGNGLSNLTVFVNDSVGNLNSSHFTIFTVDTVYPRLLINHPTNLSNHSVNTISLNITSVDTNLDSCWVTNVTGQNQSFTCLANTTISGPDGTHNITIFANDSAGNLNMSGIITFTLDTVNPSLVILLPTNLSNFSSSLVSLNISVFDTGTGLNGTCTFVNTSGATTGFTCLSNTTMSGLGDGTHNVTATVKDLIRNSNTSDVITFTVDTTAPSLIVNGPANVTYRATNLSLNVSVFDSTIGLDSTCWYSLNGTANVSFTCLANTTFVANDCVQHNVTVYSNDTLNNVNQSSTILFSIYTSDASCNPTTPSAASSGGGGGSGGTKAATVTAGEVKAIGRLSAVGTNREMSTGATVSFVLPNEETHTAKVLNVDKEKQEVEVEVSSTPQKIKIKVGETVQVDLTGDEKAEIGVTLIEITEKGNALLNFIRYDDRPVVKRGAAREEALEANDDTKEEGNENVLGKLAAGDVKEAVKSIPWWIWWVTVVIILTAFTTWYYFTKIRY